MSLDFDAVLKELYNSEQIKVKNQKIVTLENLVPILLERIHPENVQELIAILKQSVLPSICSDVDDELEKLFERIEKKPELIFDKKIQKDIEDFISKRFEKDKQIVIERTSDITKFVILMEQLLNEAITSNGSSSQTVLNIREKIESIHLDDNGIDALTKLQVELINAASLIEKEMNSVTNKLQTGKSQVQQLEEKIKSLEEELNKSKTESMKDHLTGLLTRRAYEEEIKKIESYYQRTDNIQYAIVFFDLDHFKNLNDTYGHECGDVVLSTFGKILNKHTRDHDIVVRYGGEEFVAIVHFNLNRELLQYLKRIKTIVTENSFLYKDKKIKVTFSAGVALRASFDSYENALQKADKLLYQAKESGRNKIILENGMEI